MRQRRNSGEQTGLKNEICLQLIHLRDAVETLFDASVAMKVLAAEQVARVGGLLRRIRISGETARRIRETLAG